LDMFEGVMVRENASNSTWCLPIRCCLWLSSKKKHKKTSSASTHSVCLVV